MLGQYYTLLHQYCEDEGFPSPPPPMSEVITVWRNDFQPAMKDVEALTIIARGRAVHVQMPAIENGRPTPGYDRRPSAQNLSAPRNGPPSSSRSSSPSMISNGRASRISSVSTMPTSPEPPSPKREPSPPPTAPSYNHLLSPMSFGQPTPQPAYIAHSPAGPNVDYFSRGRQASTSTLSTVSTPAAGTLTKKKPPPPPPKKREFVTAIYSFDGMSLGDLSFKEGDRIKVIKKTDSRDDWWEGELAGRKGSFPANYCK